MRFGGAELVVRRPPLGPVPPKAHDMAREYRWLAALHPVFPLAPRPYVLCEDPKVIGSVFYVMERRRGLVVRNEEPLPLSDKPEARRLVSEALVDTLADLHARRRDAATARRARQAGWLRRTPGPRLDRAMERIEDSTPVPEMEALAAWLAAQAARSPRAAGRRARRLQAR